MCSLTIWLMGWSPQALLVLGSRLKSWYIRWRSAATHTHTHSQNAVTGPSLRPPAPTTKTAVSTSLYHETNARAGTCKVAAAADCHVSCQWPTARRECHVACTRSLAHNLTFRLAFSQQSPAAGLLLVQERCLMICQQLLLALLQQLLLTHPIQVCMHALRLLLQSLLGLQHHQSFSREHRARKKAIIAGECC